MMLQPATRDSRATPERTGTGRSAGSIDRAALVARHRVRLTGFDPRSPLTLGNGEFAFTADVTGLQTFPEAYVAAGGVPLCTQAQWGWHTTPPGPDVAPDQVRYASFDTHGRSVPYLTDSAGQRPTFDWLRQNPHRLHLGRVGLDLRDRAGRSATLDDCVAIDQTLDPWRGLLTSRFTFDGSPVVVETCCAGDTDAIAVRVRSPLLADGRLSIAVAFPYGSPTPSAADWERPTAHRSMLTTPAPGRAEIARALDEDRYHVRLHFDARARCREASPHVFRLATENADSLELVCGFSPQPDFSLPTTFEAALAASDSMWVDFWQSGAAIDLSGNADERADELERRIVLSQYLMRANCAGSLPPAETGITCNSWYGKFHLEMHWWHGVHFALWGRLPLLERSLSYYGRILPEARRIAQRQGYRGVRWPKMVDARGIDAPSPVGPLLLWQQPHPIYYAELVHRQRPDRATLEAWADIVEQTAEFMASFVVEIDGQYVLGPPMKSAQENNDTLTTRNPTFELTYWRFGLATAQRWRERRGLPRHAHWDDVLARLAPPPQAEGRYLYHDGLLDTYTTWNWEHPAIVGALGMLPGDGIDPAVMRRSVEQVMADWQWDRCWGWDFPMTAMCAARVGRPDLAIDALFLDSAKNHFAASGNVYQRPDLTLYLPANGGLLTAVAMMAGGWDGAADRPAPGFPPDWRVRAEGFETMI